MALSATVLSEDSAQQRPNHAALHPTDMGRGVTHNVHAAALSSRMEDLGDSHLETFVSIRDNRLYPAQGTAHQATKEVSPKRLSFGRATRMPRISRPC